jgi:integrase
MDLLPELRSHVERFAESGKDGRLFIGPKGATLRRQNFNQRIWSKARTALGMPELPLHDLRHTGGTLTAGAGASLKELMGRLGHASTRAALIYQHRTQERDRAIAAALGEAFTAVRTQAPDLSRQEREAGDTPSGTDLARKRKRGS